jgi:hypothetical protein
MVIRSVRHEATSEQEESIGGPFIPPLYAYLPSPERRRLTIYSDRSSALYAKYLAYPRRDAGAQTGARPAHQPECHQRAEIHAGESEPVESCPGLKMRGGF